MQSIPGHRGVSDVREDNVLSGLMGVGTYRMKVILPALRVDEREIGHILGALVVVVVVVVVAVVVGESQGTAKKADL